MNCIRNFLIFLFLVIACGSHASDNVIDTASQIVVSEIVLEGNKTTKSFIVYRELMFAKGDSLFLDDFIEKVKLSKQNLLNTSLFNFVSITPLFKDSDNVIVIVTMEERWYTWPFPILDIKDRNFNTWWESKNLHRLDYGLKLTKDNFRGRQEKLSLIFSFGYDESYGLEYTIPYFDKKRKFGMGFSFHFQGNHEVAWGCNNNKLQYYKDNEKYVQTERYASGELTLRNNIYNYHALKYEYFDFSFSDSVMALNGDYSLNGLGVSQYFALYYKYKWDHRDFKSYPLHGWFAELELKQSGLGILNDKSHSYSYMHSSARFYRHIKKRLYYGLGANLKTSSGKVKAFRIHQGMGFENDLIRGYEYYVINGQHFGIFKTSFKYELVANRIMHPSFIKLNKFDKIPYSIYLSVYSDIGYVKDDNHFVNNNLGNSFLLGSGIGIDYVTYYDKVLRVEYSINKLGESGVFIHFIAPI